MLHDCRIVGHFEVETGRYQLAHTVEVVILNMAPIDAQMDGNGVGTGSFTDACSLKQVGVGGPARLAQGGDMVDVDTQFNIITHG